MSRARHWCFTVNNPTAEDGEFLEKAHKEGKISYLVAGQEIGTEGTPHIQGYVVLAKKLSLAGVKKLLPRAHLEQARGTPQENYNYCSKQDKEPLELGERPESPQTLGGAAIKRKYEEAWALAKKGKCGTKICNLTWL